MPSACVPRNWGAKFICVTLSPSEACMLCVWSNDVTGALPVMPMQLGHSKQLPRNAQMPTAINEVQPAWAISLQASQSSLDVL